MTVTIVTNLWGVTETPKGYEVCILKGLDYMCPPDHLQSFMSICTHQPGSNFIACIEFFMDIDKRVQGCENS